MKVARTESDERLRGRRNEKKVALVCDWLTNVGGAEKVLLKIHEMYPDAPIYTSQYNPKKIDWFLGADVRTGWLQKLPTRLRKFLGPLRQRYFEKLDLSEYDLVISVTGAEAKAVKTRNEKTGKKAVHISYCHVPTQYYWQMYDDYVENPGFGVLNPVVRFCFKKMVAPLRKRDYEAASKVDQFVTISEYARGLIRKYYRRNAKIVHPPVDIDNFSISSVKSQEGQGNKSRKSQEDRELWLKNILEKSQGAEMAGGCGKLVENFETRGGFYVTTSRQVTWKRLDLAVKACVEKGRPLLVVGEGPEHNALMKMADNAPLVRFLPLMGKRELAMILSCARGYLFPSLEPFGIAPVEAMGVGCPVIAYGEGGARDYVIPGVNGVMFDEQTVASMVRAIDEFETKKFDKEKIAESVAKFGEERFVREIEEVTKECLKSGANKKDDSEAQ